ncbi:MAG: glycosyltransferase family 39 protein, partial [Acidobacteria bacterium]|nr:glycosyltransferase family 39 protein [Acidobacteriota bacterium]
MRTGIFFMSIQRKSELAVFAVILLTAAFFRFNQLELYPPGLYPDEAMNGNNALHSIETGEYRVFYPENNGREGMFINIQSLSVRVFGNTPWALRAVSALFGTLTVAGLYLLTRRLFNWQIAAIAGFLMAISFWHVVFSRIGFRAIMAPLLLVWGLYFFWRGLSF